VPGEEPEEEAAQEPDLSSAEVGSALCEGSPAVEETPFVAWDRKEHGVRGIPPCRECRGAMKRIGGRAGMQLWSDHWQCPYCKWEVHLSYGRGSV